MFGGWKESQLEIVEDYSIEGASLLFCKCACRERYVLTYRPVNSNFYPHYFVTTFNFFSCFFSQKQEVLLIHTIVITVFHLLLTDTKMSQMETLKQGFRLRVESPTSNLFHGKSFSKVKIFFLLMLLTAIFALPG